MHMLLRPICLTTEVTEHQRARAILAAHVERVRRERRIARARRFGHKLAGRVTMPDLRRPKAALQTG